MTALALCVAACGASGATLRATGNSAPSSTSTPRTSGLPSTSSSEPAASSSSAAPPPSVTSTSTPVPSSPPESTDVVGTARSGTLTATITVSAARPSPGAMVEITVSANDPDAHGVLTHELSFGDGSGDYTANPLFCLATVSPRSQAWNVQHAYDHAGTYTVSATVSANCTPDHVTVSVPLSVG